MAPSDPSDASSARRWCDALTPAQATLQRSPACQLARIALEAFTPPPPSAVLLASLYAHARGGADGQLLKRVEALWLAPMAAAVGEDLERLKGEVRARFGIGSGALELPAAAVGPWNLVLEERLLLEELGLGPKSRRALTADLSQRRGEFVVEPGPWRLEVKRDDREERVEGFVLQHGLKAPAQRVADVHLSFHQPQGTRLRLCDTLIADDEDFFRHHLKRPARGVVAHGGRGFTVSLQPPEGSQYVLEGGPAAGPLTWLEWKPR